MHVSVGNADTVLRFDAAATGDAMPQARLGGLNPHGPTFLAIDVPHDRLAATSTNFTPVVVLLDNASVNGSPARIVFGAATGLKFPAFCAFDSARDLLYVTDDTNLLVFSPASPSAAMLRRFAPLLCLFSREGLPSMPPMIGCFSLMRSTTRSPSSTPSVF